VLNCSLLERRTVTQLFSPVSGEHGPDALPALGPFVYADAVKAVGPLVGYGGDDPLVFIMLAFGAGP
jgi:hypothetical protein